MKKPLKLYKDLDQKDLLSILLFIVPGLKDGIKPVKMNVKRLIWAETFKLEFDDSAKSLYIRRFVVRSHDNHAYDELIPEAIKIKPNWNITYRHSVYKGETRTCVYYNNDWDSPDNILKVYKYITSLGYVVEAEE